MYFNVSMYCEYTQNNRGCIEKECIYVFRVYTHGSCIVDRRIMYNKIRMYFVWTHKEELTVNASTKCDVRLNA